VSCAFLVAFLLEAGHVLNPEQRRPVLLTMVAVSKLATFESMRKGVVLGLDFYLNKNHFKQGVFKGRVGAGQNFRHPSRVTIASR
jgi:hypothetical protein